MLLPCFRKIKITSILQFCLDAASLLSDFSHSFVIQYPSYFFSCYSSLFTLFFLFLFSLPSSFHSFPTLFLPHLSSPSLSNIIPPLFHIVFNYLHFHLLHPHTVSFFLSLSCKGNTSATTSHQQSSYECSSLVNSTSSSWGSAGQPATILIHVSW